MPSLDQFQAAIISRLKEYQPLVDAVGEEIREDEWQGSDFAYPCVRVAVQKAQKTNDGCNWTVTFMLSSFSADASSKSTLQIATLVLRALKNKQLVVGNARTSICTDTVLTFPYRTGARAWRVDHVWTTIIATTAFES